MPETTKWTKWTENSPVGDEQLLDRWSALVRHVSRVVGRSYKLKPEDVEDVESEITLRLLRIPQSKRQYEFYARVVINNAAREVIHKLMARGGGPRSGWRDYSTLSYRQAAPPRDPNAEDEASDVDRAIGGTPNPESDLVDSITLDSLTAKLPERERVAVCGYYGENLTLEEIATQLGCSIQTVRNLLKAALRRLRRGL
jgi:RNA polymerase sigma factor (sigma-70 family)